MKKNYFMIAMLAVLTVACLCSCGSPKKTENATPQVSPAITEEHSLGLTSIGNARELGGYKTADGKTVKHGKILRSASLSNASEADIKRLKDVYHLSEVIDLRMNREIESKPDPEIDGVKNLQLGIIDEQLMAQRSEQLTEADLEGIDLSDKIGQLKFAMKIGILGDQMYINFLSGNQGKENYKRMFEELLSLPKENSLLFHCTQGKDRTGCAAMLILAALGVDEDTIMRDFMLTNTYNASLIESERQMLVKQGYKGDELDTLMIAMDQVNSQYMQNTLDWIKTNYGSINGYITNALGITEEQINTLKNTYLE